MRILAGSFKGQVIEQPKSAKVRPMSQKVRAAIFDVVGDVTGLQVLDLYAGSGAVGLEALSRGAAKATFVESNPAVANVIKRNVESLDVRTQTDVITWDAAHWLAHHLPLKIDLIVADPPYNEIKAEILDQAGHLLETAGILVVSQTSQIEPFKLQSVKLVKTKVYGDTALGFYKK